VIDFVLQDPRIPSCSFDHLVLRVLVKTGYAHGARPRNQGRKTGETQAALEKFCLFLPDDFKLRIDDDVKRKRAALALLQQRFSNFLVIFFAVFDHRKLQREPQLRSREAYAGRFAHARSHGFDQFANFAAADFREAQRSGALPQNRVPSLDDFKFRRFHKDRSRAGANHALLDFISIREDIREERRHKMKS